MKKIFLLLIIFLSSNDKLWANVSPKIETNKKSTVLSGTDPPQISFMYKTATGFRANIFDNYTDETNYEFEYKVGTGAWITGLNFGPYANSSIKTISVTFSPPAGTTVGITGRLRAKFGSGAAVTYSNYSADYYFIYSNNVPETPLTIGLASLSETTTVMSWTPGSVNETHYVIERADENLNYRRIRLVASNVLQINDGGLKHNTFYSYRVMACNTSGCSDYKYGDVRTLDGTPAAPSKVGLLPLSPNKMLVSWNDIAINETNYVVQRADENGVYGTIAGVLASNTKDFIDEKVKPNTRYFYRVAAKNTYGISSFTDIGDAITPSGIPNMPGQVGLLTLSPTRLLVSWADRSDDETNFVLQRADINGNYVTLPKISANTVNFYDGGLTPNTRYFYRVASTNKFGTSEFLNIGDIYTATGNPTNLIASASSPVAVNLNWADNTNEESGFEIQRADSDSVFVKIGSVLNNVTSFVDKNVKVNAKYFYRVVVLFGKKSFGFAQTSFVTPSGIPNMPTQIGMAALSPTKLLISWADKSDDETGFILQRADINGNYVSLPQLNANTINFIDNGLIPNTRYFYRVASTNSYGTSEFLNIGDIFTSTGNPTNFNASAKGPTAVNLIWNYTTNEEIGFEIQRADTNLVFEKVDTVLKNITTYIDDTVNENTKYFYRLITLFEKSTSGFVEDSVKTPFVIPNSPSNAVAEALNFNKIKITWEDNASDELKFEIERSTNGGEFEKIGSVLRDSTTFIDNSVIENTLYLYQVKSLSTFKESNYVQSNVVKTPIEKVIAPTNLVAFTNSYNLVNLTWLSNAKNVLNYEIERSIDSINYVSIAKVDSSKRSFNDSTIIENSKYIYKITTIGYLANSESILSNSVMTPIQQVNSVTNFKAEAVAFNYIFLNWDNQSTNITSFDLERSTNNGDFELITNLKNDLKMYVDSNLNENTIYVYRIKSLGKLDSSDFVLSNSVTTPIEKVIAPTNLVAFTNSYNLVNLTWLSNAKNVLNYEIERSSDSTNYVSIAKIDSSKRSYNDSSVVEITNYIYRIKTNGKLANSESVVSNMVMTPIQPVLPITNLLAEPILFNQVHLMWENASNNTTSFDLERSTANGNYELIANLKNDVKMYVDSNLKENTIYTYRIKSLGKLDSSDFVMSNSVTTPFEPIKKATNLTVVAKAYNEVLVTWVDNSTNETAYVLQKSFDGINFTNIELPANTITYTDKAVLDNSNYTYKVFSKNANVSSDTTDIVSAKTPLKPLNPPTNLTLKALSDNEIALTWQDNEGLETGFDIERSKDGINFSKIISVSSNVITYLNVNLDASTKYYYRVRAFNDKQTSVYSNIADISTLVTTSVIKEKLNGTIKVYPNPTSDFVTVDYPTGTYSVDLVSSFGLSISSKNVDLNSISTEINLNGLPSGVYFVSANSKSNKITKKIIKN